MARRRMIEVSIAHDETFNDLSEWAKLLFLMMLPHTDDTGRLAGAPKVIKAKCYPMGDRTLDEFVQAIAEIIRSGLLDAYHSENGSIVLQFKNRSFNRINAVLIKNSKGASEYPEPAHELSLTFEEYLSCVSRERPVSVRSELRSLGGVSHAGQVTVALADDVVGGEGESSGTLTRGDDESLAADERLPSQPSGETDPTAGEEMSGASNGFDGNADSSSPTNNPLPCETHDNHVQGSRLPRPLVSSKQKVESKKQRVERMQEGGSSENVDARDAQEPAITFALNTGVEYAISVEQAEEFQRLYPNVDVQQELREIRAWCIANPTRRKTSAGALKFVNSWLGTQQDRAQPPSTAGARTTSKRPAFLSHEQVASQSMTIADWERYDRWRHLPTGLLHYYPKGTAPASLVDYERFQA